MKYILILLLFTSLVSSLEVDFDCPKEVLVEEEFECSFEILGSEEVYDVKVDITKDGSSVARIWDSEKKDWKSAYYYLNEFSEDKVLLKITEGGEYGGLLKLREASNMEEYPFKIFVSGDSTSEEVNENLGEAGLVEENDEEILEDFSNEVLQNKEGGDGTLVLKPREETISLNSVETIEGEQILIYESREARNFRYLPYAFSLFMTFIVAFLIWDKF